MEDSKPGLLFATITALTLCLIPAFSAWFFHYVLGVPWDLVIIIVILTAVTLIPGAISGYRVWNSVKDSVPVSERVKPFVALRRTAHGVAIAVLISSGVYSFWRGRHMLGVVLAAGAAFLASYGLRNLPYAAASRSTADGSHRQALQSPPIGLGAFLAGFNVVFMIAIAMIAAARGELGVAVLPLLIAAALLPWAIRRIRADSKTRQKTGRKEAS